MKCQPQARDGSRKWGYSSEQNEHLPPKIKTEKLSYIAASDKETK